MARPVAAVVRFVLLAAALAAMPSPSAGADDPRPGDVYFRRRFDVPHAVEWLAREAERVRARQVLFVLDQVTFGPPPGDTEFSSDYGYFRDLEAWVAALGPWAAARDVSFRATTSLAPRSVAVGEPGWPEDLLGLVRRTWWADEGAFEPAPTWMSLLLQRTADADSVRTGTGPRMVVLVAGRLTPERWVPDDELAPWESEWRAKLLPVGRYWRPGDVASVLERAGAVLYVVAPEARFGDFAPVPEMPDVPWASRPQYPPEDPYAAVAPALPPEVRRRLRDLLDRALRGGRPEPGPGLAPPLPPVPPLPLPGAEGRRPGAVTPGPVPPPVPGHEAPRSSGRRFLATTPVWFPMKGAVRLWNDHSPSGYGAWPYARTCARTGGRYLFYPFPDLPWLDVCPSDDGLLDRLAPELVPIGEFLSRRAGDPALDAVCRASAVAEPKTPWADTAPDHRAASGWSGFRSSTQRQPDWFLRRRPFDDALADSQDGIRLLGERLARDVLPRYDEALPVLDAAIGRVLRGEDVRSHPRSVANLFLARFWFSMSAFHLEAYSIYAREIERFVPDSMKGHVDTVYVTYVPTIRLSDCLDAYDGRTLGPEAEAEYPRWVPGDCRGYQGNLLEIPEEDPNYRARRSIDRVLLHLDPRLRRRALDMIRAAHGVMGRYARTGWGWTTYYSDAVTFVFQPVPVARGHHPTPGSRPAPQRKPEAPRGPSSTPGGSSPGGPATGG